MLEDDGSGSGLAPAVSPSFPPFAKCAEAVLCRFSLSMVELPTPLPSCSLRCEFGLTTSGRSPSSHRCATSTWLLRPPGYMPRWRRYCWRRMGRRAASKCKPFRLRERFVNVDSLSWLRSDAPEGELTFHRMRDELVPSSLPLPMRRTEPSVPSLLAFSPPPRSHPPLPPPGTFPTSPTLPRATTSTTLTASLNRGLFAGMNSPQLLLRCASSRGNFHRTGLSTAR